MAHRPLILLGIVGFLCSSAAAAGAVEGWRMQHGAAASVCVAQAEVPGDAALSLGTLHGRIVLAITAPDQPGERGVYPVVLTIDGAAPIDMQAVGDAATFAVPVTPELGEKLAPATRLRATIGGKDYDFVLRNVGAAIAAIRACAALPKPGRSG